MGHYHARVKSTKHHPHLSCNLRARYWMKWSCPPQLQVLVVHKNRTQRAARCKKMWSQTLSVKRGHLSTEIVSSQMAILAYILFATHRSQWVRVNIEKWVDRCQRWSKDSDFIERSISHLWASKSDLHGDHSSQPDHHLLPHSLQANILGVHRGLGLHILRPRPWLPLLDRHHYSVQHPYLLTRPVNHSPKNNNARLP